MINVAHILTVDLIFPFQDLNLGLNTVDGVAPIDAGALISGTFGNNTPKGRSGDALFSNVTTDNPMALTKYCNTRDETDIMRLNSQ